ncbi:MAG TPA: hypothetical protein DCP71_02840 [Verrucomicrobiales bacterium]|nr:hypothetical protein [Verrucomicrobiales bacterium]
MNRIIDFDALEEESPALATPARPAFTGAASYPPVALPFSVKPAAAPVPVADFTPGLLTGPDLDTLALEQRPALMGHWMKRGDLGYLFAPRGAGKSWMAMLIGHAVAEGRPLGLWEAGESALPVIYFDAEMNLADVKARAHLIGIHQSPRFQFLSNERLFLAQGHGVNIADPVHQQALSRLLEDGCLFIIDNLSTAQLGMAENDNDSFDAIRDWLLTLRHRSITVLIVHHAGRNGMMRGSSRREDMAHWILSLKDDTEEGGLRKAFTTAFAKVRNCSGTQARPLRWILDTYQQPLKVDCTLHEGTEAMLCHIRDGVNRAGDLAEMMGVHVGTVSKWARKLEAGGLITIRSRQYFPVE